MATKKPVATVVTPVDTPKVKPTRWGNSAVNRKSLKLSKIDGLTVCTFSIKVKAGTDGGDIALQKMRQVKNVIVTPVGQPIGILNCYVTKNVISVNHEPVLQDEEFNIIAFGLR